MMYNKKAGVALIDNNNNILILQNNDKHGMSTKWGFPKGSLESNEDHYKCALRELYEETSIILVDFRRKFLKKCGSGKCFVYLFKINTIFEDIKIIIDPQEICDIKWISINDLLKDYKLDSSKYNVSIKVTVDYLKDNFDYIHQIKKYSKYIIAPGEYVIPKKGEKCMCYETIKKCYNCREIITSEPQKKCGIHKNCDKLISIYKTSMCDVCVEENRVIRPSGLFQ